MIYPTIPSDITKLTISHYESHPWNFWEDTKDHDVTQNYENLLRHINAKPPFRILDFGCGPGRDLKYFSNLGHHSIGLDGCEAFCRMARKYSNCEVFHQDFIRLELKADFFHGIFANASLFHVPKSKLPQVLEKLHRSLTSEGILFSSNPRGRGESWSKYRYGNYYELDEYKQIVESVGFRLIHHYYRPNNLPIEQRPWLACVFRKISDTRTMGKVKTA